MLDTSDRETWTGPDAGRRFTLWVIFWILIDLFITTGVFVLA